MSVVRNGKTCGMCSSRDKMSLIFVIMRWRVEFRPGTFRLLQGFWRNALYLPSGYHQDGGCLFLRNGFYYIYIILYFIYIILYYIYYYIILYYIILYYIILYYIILYYIILYYIILYYIILYYIILYYIIL